MLAHQSMQFWQEADERGSGEGPGDKDMTPTTPVTREQTSEMSLRIQQLHIRGSVALSNGATLKAVVSAIHRYILRFYH